MPVILLRAFLFPHSTIFFLYTEIKNALAYQGESHLNVPTIHSYFNDSTGFALAALIAWKLIVANAITKAIPPESANIHQLISILYAKFWSHLFFR